MALLQILSFVSCLSLAVATAVRDVASQNPCDGGRSYCGWYDKSNNKPPQCVCPSGQTWDSSSRTCVCPPIPLPTVGSGQKALCASNSTTYSDYDASSSLCQDNGENVVVVVVVTVTVDEQTSAIDQACAQPQCPAGQSWSDTDSKCHFPCFPESDVTSCKKKGGNAICARDPQTFCAYDSTNALCEDNGTNSFQCLQSKKGKTTTNLLEEVFASLSTSIGALGFGCLSDDKGCSLTTNVWNALCVVCDVTNLVCGILDALLGVC